MLKKKVGDPSCSIPKSFDPGHGHAGYDRFRPD